MIASHIDYDTDLLKTNESILINLDGIEHEEVSHSLARELNIDYDILRSYPSWIKINGYYYYYKERDRITTIITELVGVELSKYMNLSTVEYFLATKNDHIEGILSGNFRIRNLKYIDSSESLKITKLKRELALKYPKLFNEEYVKMLSKYLIRNYFACQGDRATNTLYYKIFYQEFLAPLFDYEDSLDNKDFIYYDSLFLNAIDDERLIGFMKHNTYLSEYLEYILNFDFGKCFSNIENQHKIKIPTCLKEEMLEFESTRKKELSKLL